jgi:hypothetical protein
MKQYYITKENITQDSPDDCFLSQTDPIHELKIASYMGGLGSEVRLAEYRVKTEEQNKVNTGEFSKAQYMKDNNIKPGTPAWFELWFGKNNGRITKSR